MGQLGEGVLGWRRTAAESLLLLYCIYLDNLLGLGI